MKDYLCTLLSNQVTMILTLVSIRMIATLFGPDEFGLYNIARRSIAVLVPISAMGIGVSLPRSIALSPNIASIRKDILSNAVLPVFLFCILINMLGVFYPSFLSFLFFGNTTLGSLVVPVLIYVSGVTLASLVHTYYRGEMKFVVSSVIHFLYLGLIPLFFVLLVRDNVNKLFSFTGTFLIVSSLFFIQFILKKNFLFSINSSLVKKHLTYGLPRVPGDIAFYLIFMLPSWVAIRTKGIQIGGDVAFACSVLNIAVGIFMPVSFIVLPKASDLFKKMEYTKLRHLVSCLLIVCFFISTIIIIVSTAFTPTIVLLLLGGDYPVIISLIRIVIIGLLPYSIFVCLRSIIDGGRTSPLNAYNCFKTIVVFLFVYGILNMLRYNDYRNSLIALVISLFALSFLTVKTTFKILFEFKQRTKL